MERHLYRRTIKYKDKEKKKPVKAWYYWYYDPKTGKRVKKSCGTAKKPVLSKKEADAIIEKLKEHDRDLSSIKGEAESATIAELAQRMFGHDDSDFIIKRREDGYLKDESTLQDVRGYLKNVIVKKYGHLKPEEIDPVIVDRDLMAANNGASWRNRVVEIMNWIFDEAIWLKMIKVKPKLKRYTRNTKTKSILTREELNKLFPDDFDQLSRIWTKNKEVTIDGVMFGVLFALTASTGLRSGEVRAINPSQLLLTDRERIVQMVGADGREAKNPLGKKTNAEIRYGLLLDRMWGKNSKELKMHLKKGNEKNKKMRIEAIPNETIRYIKHWLAIRPLSPPDLLFSYKGRRISDDNFIYRFGIGLKNAEIETEGRILKPHSLRFTYNTKMRRRIPEEKLREMLGHETKGMTDHYTVISLSELYEQFIELHDFGSNIDSFWGKKSGKKTDKKA